MSASIAMMEQMQETCKEEITEMQHYFAMEKVA